MNISDPYRRSWLRKFRDAFRGMKEGVRDQSSFAAHFCCAAAVLVAAAALRMGRVEWYVLLLCITVVLTAEMFNSALESMARAITGQPEPAPGQRPGHRQRRGAGRVAWRRRRGRDRLWEPRGYPRGLVPVGQVS